MDFTRWIYRLQQRVAITKNECTVLLILTLLFGAGLVARVLQQDLRPLPETTYAETDRLFQERSRRLASDSARPQTARLPSAALPTRINLNTAPAARLEHLPHIGPAKARRIIAYRTAHGGFRRVEELRRVRGIGPKTLADLRDRVVVE